MATTTARRRSTHPMSYYRNMVKDMDDSQKLELVSFIIDSMRSTKADDLTMEEVLEGYPYKRYTKAELNAMLDEAERDFEAGLGIDDDEVWKEDEEEFERELAEEQKLQMEAV
ncbi:MAG: hypothetical protein IKP43_07640 [Bacteroidaceae bacterium]|nr:hypothetical protein [Bacteroidaceae bacterium]